jgi:ATP-binding cassette subfamily G (WHITE) protein 2 (SNQ2)
LKFDHIPFTAVAFNCHTTNMWGTNVLSPVEDRSRNPWHSEDAARRTQPEESAETPSPESNNGAASSSISGTWGEYDAGEIRRPAAMQDFEQLRETLSSLSRTRSQDPGAEGLRPISRKSTARKQKALRRESTTTADTDGPGDAGDAAAEKNDDFQLDQFMREGHFEKRKDGQSAKKVGVVWKNLNVKGVGSTASFVRTLPNAILGTFGPDLYHILSGFIPALKLKRHSQTRTLIHDFSGVLKDGEMMLVLGRPGSGCSTFLKAIANNREGYAEITGDVSYGGIPAAKQKKQFRGEVNYNEENDTHFANLNVWQTLYFALMNKTKKNDKAEIPIILEALLKMFGISHTKYTPVGDEYVRGVSGGERKRVSANSWSQTIKPPDTHQVSFHHSQSKIQNVYQVIHD